MNDFTFYFGYGWDHIISIQALDHLLFLAALTAAYSLKKWKHVAVLVTAFTIGHSITLAVSIYDIVRFNSDWVEFLIPLSIVITCFYNIWFAQSRRPVVFQYLMAMLFGLIHGMGFANTLRFMLSSKQNIAFPLLGFNIGIEAAQIVIVFILLIIHFVVVEKIKFADKWWIYFLSIATGLTALYMCITRWPF